VEHERLVAATAYLSQASLPAVRVWTCVTPPPVGHPHQPMPSGFRNRQKLMGITSNPLEQVVGI